MVLDPFDHAGGRAGKVGLVDHLGRALGMRDDLHAGIGFAIGTQLVRGEALMHLAMALPGDDLDIGLRLHPFGQELVGNHDDAFGAERFHHAHRVRRGAADIRLGLHVRRRVHIGHDRHAGISLAQRPHVCAGDRGGKRAARAQVGDQHFLVRVEELRGLCHKMHAALHDDLGVGLGRLAGKLQRVADDIGDAMEDFGRHVVMRQHDRVPRPLQIVDGLDVGRKAGPLDRRDHAGDALIEMRGLAGHFGRVGEIGQKRLGQSRVHLRLAPRRADMKRRHETKTSCRHNAHTEHIWVVKRSGTRPAHSPILS